MTAAKNPGRADVVRAAATIMAMLLAMLVTTVVTSGQSPILRELANRAVPLALVVPVAVAMVPAERLRPDMRVARDALRESRAYLATLNVPMLALFALLCATGLRNPVTTLFQAPVIVIANVMLAVLEEFAFRGVLQHALVACANDGAGTRRAIARQAVAFMLAHVASIATAALAFPPLAVMRVVELVIVGTFLGLVAHKQGNLTGAVAVHFASDVVCELTQGMAPMSVASFGSLAPTLVVFVASLTLVPKVRRLMAEV